MSRSPSSFGFTASLKIGQAVFKVKQAQIHYVQLAPHQEAVITTLPSTSKILESKSCRELRAARELLAAQTIEKLTSGFSIINHTIRPTLPAAVLAPKVQIAHLHAATPAVQSTTIDSDTTKSALEHPVVRLPAHNNFPGTKISRELQNAYEREVGKVISRHQQEITPCTKAFRSSGVYKGPSCMLPKTPGKVIPAAIIAEVIFPKEIGGSGGSGMVNEVSLGKRKGSKTSEMKGVLRCRLCSADLEDIYC